MAVVSNVLMVVGTYVEYLWAGEWFDHGTSCVAPQDLLSLLNCFRTYTYSDAMMRGRNLELFAAVGSIVAVCFVKLEHDRIKHLRELVARRQELGVSQADSWKPRVALRCLSGFSVAIFMAFGGVLLLVPFHLERPVMHYLVAGICFSSTFAAMCFYLAIPLAIEPAATDDISGGAEAASASEYNAASLGEWALRRQRQLPFMALCIAVQLATVSIGALRFAVPNDFMGRLFGACEVLVILSYQLFVALFAIDDAAIALPLCRTGTTGLHSPLCAASGEGKMS